MGWCGATEIMDAAIGAAEAAVASVLTEFGPPASESAVRERMDEELRPFVKAIASHLNDGDWDCHSESEYYDRFAQEMHGWDDERYMDHLTEELADEVRHEGVTDRYRQLVARIERHYEKTRMEKNANGG